MTPKLILASASPRRRELLGYLGLPFEVITSDFDEESISTEGITPAGWVMALAKGKALVVAKNAPSFAPSPPSPLPRTGEGGEEAVYRRDSSLQAWGTGEDYSLQNPPPFQGGVRGGFPTSLILGADTTVVLNGEYLNKPTDAEDAKRMLRRLSGNTHQVYTGICLIEIKDGQVQPPICDYAMTDVTFDEMTDETIAAYVATGEPLDKAGAYGIQGKALAFIPKINGDYFNVVGLPLNKLVALLGQFGVSVW